MMLRRPQGPPGTSWPAEPAVYTQERGAAQGRGITPRLSALLGYRGVPESREALHTLRESLLFPLGHISSLGGIIWKSLL